MRVIALAICLIAACPATAATVAVERGNIVLIDKSRRTVLTHSGHDSDPVLSPDGKRIYFSRTGTATKAMAPCSLDGTPVQTVALWRVDRDGEGATKLLDGHGADNPQSGLCAFAHKQFSTDGSRLYFDTPAWATSDAVHVMDVAKGTEKFFLPGSVVRVLAGCRDKRYRDALIVNQHRYFVFSGSYDWDWLFSPQGKEIGPVGENSSNSIFVDDACDYGG
jgi:hypothetical protein